MSNSRLTPPATTAAEIQDEARTSAADSQAQAAASTSAPPRQDPYQVAFQDLSQLATQSKWNDLITAAELSELNGDRQRTMLLVTVPLVLACLIEDELPRAHFALQRLPSNLQSTPLATELASLLSATARRQHSRVYSGAQALFDQTSEPSPQDAPLYTIVAGMVTVFIDAFRKRTFEVVSKAYTSLPLSLAEMYFGLAADRLVEAIKAYQWSYDSTTQTITPKPSATSIAVSKGGASTLAKFDFIASSVARLEM